MQLLYALGVVIVLVLLWQAVTWFNTYRHSLRLKLEPVPPAPDFEINPNPELGKVRVRPRVTETHSADSVNVRQKPAFSEPVFSAALAAGNPAVDSSAINQFFSTSVQASASSETESLPASDDAGNDSSNDAGDESVPVLLSPVMSNQLDAGVEQHDMFAHEPIAPPPKKGEYAASAHSGKTNRASILYETPVIEPVRSVASPLPEEKTHVDVQDVICMHVVSGAHAFNGEDLLRAILAYGLRFGEMSIFHRHEQATGQGRILFSMAKAVEPGIFDLEAMTGEEIPGVSFFLSLPGVNSIHAYDIMVDTAKRLATELQGHILDEQQQPLTRQLIEHYREQVQEFERRRLTIRPVR